LGANIQPSEMMTELLPLFLNLTGRAVLLVGGGRVATAKLQQLLAVGARVTVVSPSTSDEIKSLVGRPFQGRLGEPERLALRLLTQQRTSTARSRSGGARS